MNLFILECADVSIAAYIENTSCQLSVSFCNQQPLTPRFSGTIRPDISASATFHFSFSELVAVQLLLEQPQQQQQKQQQPQQDFLVMILKINLEDRLLRLAFLLYQCPCLLKVVKPFPQTVEPVAVNLNLK